MQVSGGDFGINKTVYPESVDSVPRMTMGELPSEITDDITFINPIQAVSNVTPTQNVVVNTSDVSFLAKYKKPILIGAAILAAYMLFFRNKGSARFAKNPVDMSKLSEKEKDELRNAESLGFGYTTTDDVKKNPVKDKIIKWYLENDKVVYKHKDELSETAKEQILSFVEMGYKKGLVFREYDKETNTDFDYATGLVNNEDINKKLKKPSQDLIDRLSSLDDVVFKRK